MNVSHLSHYASAGFGYVMGARARRATSVSSFATIEVYFDYRKYQLQILW